MAHGRPWYQRNGGDFLMATIGFPDIETRWVYSAIIDMLNDRDRPIPDDAKFICGFTGLSGKKWSIARRYLLDHDKLELDADGNLTNPRFERERSARQTKRGAAATAGSKGGKQAAANRAKAQGDLAFTTGNDAQSTPETMAETTPETTLETNCDQPETINSEIPENNDLAVANAVASRVRERASEARGESLEKKKDTPTTANPTPRGAQPNPADDEEKWDLLGITNRCAKAGAVSLHKESTRARAMDLVKGWIADGIDIEATAIPTIERQLRDTKETSIGGLEFYAARVRKAHADAPAPSKPMDPDERVAAQRRTVALYRRMGRHAEADAIEATLPDTS